MLCTLVRYDLTLTAKYLLTQDWAWCGIFPASVSYYVSSLFRLFKILLKIYSCFKRDFVEITLSNSLKVYIYLSLKCLSRSHILHNFFDFIHKIQHNTISVTWYHNWKKIWRCLKPHLTPRPCSWMFSYSCWLDYVWLKAKHSQVIDKLISWSVWFIVQQINIKISH
jgi:hypothetical protein